MVSMRIRTWIYVQFFISLTLENRHFCGILSLVTVTRGRHRGGITSFITGSTRAFFILFLLYIFSVHCTLCIFVFYNHCCLVRINKWMDGLADGAFYTMYAHSPHGETAAALMAFALFECSC